MNHIPSPQTGDGAIEQEIRARGLTAPRVTPADIEANIASEHYFTADQAVIEANCTREIIAGRIVRLAAVDGLKDDGNSVIESLRLLTFCVLVLRNGFTVTGESACASPENFDAEIGRKIARTNAVNKIWPLMGYELKQKLHEVSSTPPAPGSAHAGYSTMQPHQQRVVDEMVQLSDKTDKLNAFMQGEKFHIVCDEDERINLIHQYNAMTSYREILKDRIAAFIEGNAA